MLEDCLLLVLKLVRCHMRPQTSRRHATTARNLHTAVSEGHSSGSAEGIQAAAASAASIRLSGAGMGRHGAQSSGDQQDGVSNATSCAEREFLESFAALVAALPEVVQAWPEATRGRAAAMLRCFLARCCTCTAEMHITAEASVLSRLAPHQQRAIFGGRPLEEDTTAAAQQLLADAAAVMCSAGIKMCETSTSEEQGPEAGALWQAEEVALGIELLRHGALLRGDVAAALQWPTDAAELLPQSAHSTPFLLDAAGGIRSEALAMKGLQVAAAAACHAGQACTLFDHDLQRLLHALATTMIANPLQAVRNAAHYATDAVLDALTVRARLCAIESLFEEGHPGLSALVIRRVTHDTQALWPQADGPELPQEGAVSRSGGAEAVQQWHELEPALLPLIRAWLEPHGSQGWRGPSGVLRYAEPICAALNLFKLLLLRARHSNCVPGVTERRQVVEVRERCLTPLRVAALHSLAELKAADATASTEHTDAVLAIERVLLVLTWVLGAVEEHMVGPVQ
ncbi:g8278 [Coccomyxa elongata]